MNIVDAYNIALASYMSQQPNKEGFIFTIEDNFSSDPDLEAVWNSLSQAEQNALHNFSAKNASLFEELPEHYRTQEDMEDREYIIQKISDELVKTLPQLID